MAHVEESGSSIKLFSFGHTFGVPKNTDLMFSVRHLPATNVDNHQQYDGRHKRIQNELLQLPEYESILQTISEQIRNFISDHKQSCMSVAVGCEQGQHRSVAIVERLAEQLGETHRVEVTHRDLQRTRFNKTKQRERATHRDMKYNCFDDDA